MFNKVTLFLVTLLFSHSLLAEEWVFQTRVQTGLLDYDLSLTEPAPSPNITDGVNIDITNNQSSNGLGDTLVTLGLGGTAAYGNYFVDLYVQRGISGELDRSDNVRGSIIGENIDLDRDDFAISFGRSFGQFSLGIGYKQSETTFDQNFTLLDPMIDNPVDPDNRIDGNLRSSFELDGPFISAAYGFKIGTGNLSAKIAVADLTGQWDINQTDRMGNDLATSASGDATGVTFGLAWKAPINQDWAYSISTDYYDYDFDVSGTNPTFNGEPLTGRQGINNFNLQERVFSLNAAIIYTF